MRLFTDIPRFVYTCNTGNQPNWSREAGMVDLRECTRNEENTSFFFFFFFFYIYLFFLFIYLLIYFWFLFFFIFFLISLFFWEAEEKLPHRRKPHMLWFCLQLAWFLLIFFSLLPFFIHVLHNKYHDPKNDVKLEELGQEVPQRFRMSEVYFFFSFLRGTQRRHRAFVMVERVSPLRELGRECWISFANGVMSRRANVCAPKCIVYLRESQLWLIPSSPPLFFSFLCMHVCVCVVFFFFFFFYFYFFPLFVLFVSLFVSFIFVLSILVKKECWEKLRRFQSVPFEKVQMWTTFVKPLPPHSRPEAIPECWTLTFVGERPFLNLWKPEMQGVTHAWWISSVFSSFFFLLFFSCCLSASIWKFFFWEHLKSAEFHVHEKSTIKFNFPSQEGGRMLQTKIVGFLVRSQNRPKTTPL